MDSPTGDTPRVIDPPEPSILAHYSDEGLQRIVDWVYAARGIVATPSYAVEADRAATAVGEVEL